MNKALWIGQILLALAFLGAGGHKLLMPASELNAQFGQGFPPGFGRVIGALEVAGAVGVVVPAATGILSVLSPVAAGGLAAIMVGATLHAPLPGGVCPRSATARATCVGSLRGLRPRAAASTHSAGSQRLMALWR